MVPRRHTEYRPGERLLAVSALQPSRSRREPFDLVTTSADVAEDVDKLYRDVAADGDNRRVANVGGH